MARADAATLTGRGDSVRNVMIGAFHPPEARHHSSTTPASLPAASGAQARWRSLVGPRLPWRFGRPWRRWREPAAPLAGAVAEVVFRQSLHAVARGRSEERPLYPNPRLLFLVGPAEPRGAPAECRRGRGGWCARGHSKRR